MKRKVISLAVAVLLICAMAIPASAATRYTDGTYGECTYSTFTTCSSTSFQSLIEMTACSGDYSDYTFSVSVVYYLYDDEGYPIDRHTVSTTPTTMISSIYRSVSELYSTTSTYYINGSSLSPITVNA